MTILFSCCLAINALLVLILIGQSWSRAFARLAGSAVNPLFVFCLLSILFNIDFIVVWNNPALEFLEEFKSLSHETIIQAYILYTLLSIGTFLGLIAALNWWPRSASKPHDHVSMRHEPAAVMSAQILFALVLAFSIPAMLGFDYDPALENVSFQVVSRQATIFSLAPWLIPTATALFVAYRPRPFSAMGISMLGVALTLFAMAGTGRSPILIILLVIGVAYANSHRISVLWYAPVIPGMILFLAYFGYFFRESQNYESFRDYVAFNGGVVQLMFGGEQLSFAKMFVVVYQTAPSVPRAPFESVLALLALPIPRSIFAMKPFGASAVFTEYISPFRWEWTKSELLITGYGDLYSQFGALGAFLAIFALSFLWLWSCLGVIHVSRQMMKLWTPLLTWSMIIFVRGDLFNIGLLLWPAVVAIVLHRLLQNVLQRLTRRRRHRGSAVFAMSKRPA